MPLPDFSSDTLFPSFPCLPIEADPPPSPSSRPSPNAVVPYPPNNSEPSSSLPPPYVAGASSSSSSGSPSATSGPSAPLNEPATPPPPPPSYSPSATETTHFLLAQVKQNMTITKPTLIATDRDGSDFAITFEDRGIDLRPVKMGWTIVVPGAVRSKAVKGKRGFVRVPEGRGTGVHYLPAGLERVMELGRRLNEVEGVAKEGEEGEGLEDEEEERGCVTCGKEEGEGPTRTLMKCTGCGRVKYCGKECQKKDWTEGGHKSDCKVFKAMAVTWGS